MNSDIRVATPPPKPLMVFDGDCHFCTLWIRRWRQMTGENVDYLPFQDSRIATRFPEISRERFEMSVQLIETDGRVCSGAEAVFRSLAKSPKTQWPLRWYKNSPAFARFSERGYRFVAEHRPAFSILTRFFWGGHVEKPDYFLVRWSFLRALGIIYFIAFLSLWVQIGGLVGSNGILPANDFMAGVKQYFDDNEIGPDRYHVLPTLCWFNASDGFLKLQCAAGVTLAVLLIIGIAPAPSLALLWLIYLSLTTISRNFLGFQWDNLLLETGFLAIFFAPLQWLPRPSRESPPSRLVLWLFRWLLFRFMFESGCVKLLSGDPSWHHLTALTVHYETQPLPTWIGWHAHQLPLWAQKTGCFALFAVELAFTFLIFLPRRLRFFVCGWLVALQAVIFLTGNYAFFNILTMALCLLLLDDFILEKFSPARLKKVFKFQVSSFKFQTPRWRLAVNALLAAVVLSVSLWEMAAMFGVRPRFLTPVAMLQQWLSPFRSVNSYGLFAVMTTSRHEIIVEGSHDGVEWMAYEFKYKPGDVKRRPQFVAPHQPRLDWQMWFAALGSVRQNPWFANFCARLLQGSPEVLALLENNPFPDHPPRYIRAILYDYYFTNPAERRETGAWWRREFIGEYLPPVSLSGQEQRPATP